MPTRLEMSYPSAPFVVAVDIPDNSLVFDGKSFVKPDEAQFVRVVNGSNELITKPWDSATAHSIYVSNYLDLRVLGSTPTAEPSLMDVEVVDDPANGECICALTCQGTKLAYVKVQNESPT